MKYVYLLKDSIKQYKKPTFIINDLQNCFPPILKLFKVTSYAVAKKKINS